MADAGGFVIRKVTPEGIVSIIAGSVTTQGYVDGKGSEARSRNPEGLATDTFGNLYVGDLNAAIRKVTPEGIVSTIAGKAPTVLPMAHQLIQGSGRPSGIAVDLDGNIYVADVWNSRIRKVNK